MTPSERRDRAPDTGTETDTAEPLVINEVQLILAEKRTSLAVMRTGIAILALPMSVLSVLIATSKYYEVFHVLHFLVPLGVLMLVLVLFGGHLVVHSIIQMRRHDRLFMNSSSRIA